ncbi:MAG TPA: DNA internalization-related competence protein ComEC/Rec2 [Syntrophomonadaceae bacterium]|nr:DNA internalization-related competence protein ComEC/Rec2 [Syntrophomonadaceae bacterium]
MVRSWFLNFLIVLSALLLAYYDFFLIALFLFAGLIIYLILTSKLSLEFLILLIIFLLSELFFNLSFVSLPSSLPSYDNYELSGHVVNYPTFDGVRGSFILQTDNEDKLKEKVQVFVNFDTSLNKGDLLQIKGKLTPPVSPGNPGEFDYKAHLHREGINYILNVKKPQDIRLIASNTNVLYQLSSKYRHNIETSTIKYMGSDDASILLGMLLGKKENIDQNQYEEFQRTGIVHVFAVSGLHVGFLLLFFHGILSLIGVSSRNKFYVSIVVLLAYGTLVGWPISVQRASLMAGLGLFALYVRGEKNLLNSLGLAGLIIIFLDPYAPFKIAFQLSFAATWGLVYLYPIIKNSLPFENKAIDYILIPLCAQIPTVPLIAYHFNLFTPISIITNVLLGYIIGLIVILGFTAIVVLIFSSLLFSFITIPIGALINLVLFSNHLLVNIPGAYMRVATPSMIVIMIYYIGLALIIYQLVKGWNRKIFITGVLLIAMHLIIISLPASLFNKGKVEIVMIDVGQGDSILLKSPQGKFILIDGGGSDFTDVGKRKVLAYLYHRGIRNLFLVINSHPDTDHLRGLETVVSEISTRNIIIPYPLKDVEDYEKLKSIAQEKQVPISALHRGHFLNVEADFSFQVLTPPPEYNPKNNYNDHSLVLLAKHHDFSILLTGDIEEAGIEEMLLNSEIPNVTILKVPHHGSKSSLVTDFYEKAKPRYALISAGKNNNFGHPHFQVIEYLNDKGIISLQTNQSGLIYIETDGSKIQIKKPMLVE